MPGKVTSHSLARPGGRRVGYYELATGDGARTVVFCHAAPGCGDFDPDPEQTWARGVTLLATDRPGYGHSDLHPDDEWPTVAAAADDIAALLDERRGSAGSGPAGVAGWSAGGRVALALAARRPDLVDRVVVIGTPAPQEEVPWLTPEQSAGLDALRGQSPAQAQAALQEIFASLPTDPTAPEALQLLAASEADDADLALPGARERLTRMLRGALAQGVAGMASDIAGYGLQPWGFTPAEVRARTLLLYGARDPVAGARHGQWWQRQLPDARLEMTPGRGHLLVFSRWQRALAHLAPRHRRQDGA